MAPSAFLDVTDTDQHATTRICKTRDTFQELFKDVQSLFCHFLVHVSQILDCKPSMTLLMPFMVSGMMRIGLDKSL